MSEASAMHSDAGRDAVGDDAQRQRGLLRLRRLRHALDPGELVVVLVADHGGVRAPEDPVGGGAGGSRPWPPAQREQELGPWSSCRASLPSPPQSTPWISFVCTIDLSVLLVVLS